MDSSTNPPFSEPSAGWSFLQNQVLEQLHLRRAADRYRSLKPRPENRADFLDLTSNDYLGLGQTPGFQDQCREAIKDLPVGSGASRLLGGEFDIYQTVERQFALFKGAETALFFPSGYAANEAMAQSLRHDDAVFFSDRLNHASIIDGLRLAGLKPEQKMVYPHNDMAHLESLLRQSRSSCHLLMTESLFSMDGDLAPLAALADLAHRYRGVMIVDEAHSIGCWGHGGRGLLDQAGLSHEHVISINTCGKAMGVQGAMVCGPGWLREQLINTARPFIYTTAPSPWMAAAVGIATTWLPQLDDRRSRLHQVSEELREALMDLGFETRPSASYIIPVLCGSDSRALKLEHHLHQHGIMARAIRPPTVPEGESRVRLSLHALLDDEDVERIIQAFSTARGLLL